jgi:hypothetical protein
MTMAFSALIIPQPMEVNAGSPTFACKQQHCYKDRTDYSYKSHPFKHTYLAHPGHFIEGGAKLLEGLLADLITKILNRHLPQSKLSKLRVQRRQTANGQVPTLSQGFL